MLYCTNDVLTVNVKSMLRCHVIYGVLQTNATWDQASLRLMQYFVVILFCTERWVMLHWYHVCCDRWQCWWMLIGTHRHYVSVKALTMFVSVKLYASLPNVTCYLNCICLWKCIWRWICKEKHKDITQWPFSTFICCFFSWINSGKRTNQ